MVVPIPKVVGDYCGIGLVEVVWKVVMVILNCHFKSFIDFHNILHSFQESCGTGTASLEAKLLQHLVAMRE